MSIVNTLISRAILGLRAVGCTELAQYAKCVAYQLSVHPHEPVLVLKVQQNLEPGFWGPVVMVGPVVVTTTAPEEMTTMTKVEDRAAVALAKEALLADREGLKELFRSMLQEVLEAEMTEAIGASRGERTEGRRLPVRLLHARTHHPAWED